MIINYYESDVYDEEELEKMSIKKKRKFAKEKTDWAIEKVLQHAEEKVEDHPDWFINLDHPDVEYVHDHIKTCDEEHLDSILMEKYFDEYYLEIALSIVKQ